jgi:hypothetical protein
MTGFIRKRDVLTVFRSFGFAIAFRCLVAPKGSTFLDILTTANRI